MLKYKIYLVTGPTGKVYVGKTDREDENVRWREHVYSARYEKKYNSIRRFMKTLTAVVVIILLAITAGGVTGYFLYTDLVKDTTKIIIQQQAQIDQQTTDIQTLQKEIDVQDTKLQRDNKDINAIIDVLNKAFQPTPKDGGDSPSSFDKSMTDDMLGAGEYLHTTSGN